MPLIECRQLTREYRRGENVIKPLDRLDLDVDAGAFLALMGPSGSGKSTLLNLIAGLDRPTEGAVRVAGAVVSAMSPGELASWRARNIGFVFQSFNLLPVFTAYQN